MESGSNSIRLNTLSCPGWLPSTGSQQGTGFCSGTPVTLAHVCFVRILWKHGIISFSPVSSLKRFGRGWHRNCCPLATRTSGIIFKNFSLIWTETGLICLSWDMSYKLHFIQFGGNAIKGSMENHQRQRLRMDKNVRNRLSSIREHTAYAGELALWFATR